MSIVQLHLERSVDPERIDPVSALYTTPRLVSRRALALVAGSVLISIPALAKASPSYRRSSPAHHLADDLKPLLKRLRKRGYPDDLFQATAEALALVGVATYAAPSDSDPIIPITATPSPLRYLAWQVQSMATEIAARSGMTGADLDRLVDADANSIRPTALVWAYMTEIGSDGARLVRGLLGKDWWDDRDAHRFPALALAIATGDLLRDIDSARTVAAGMSRAMRFMDPVPGASYRTLYWSRRAALFAGRSIRHRSPGWSHGRRGIRDEPRFPLGLLHFALDWADIGGSGHERQRDRSDPGRYPGDRRFRDHRRHCHASAQPGPALVSQR